MNSLIKILFLSLFSLCVLASDRIHYLVNVPNYNIELPLVIFFHGSDSDALYFKKDMEHLAQQNVATISISQPSVLSNLETDHYGPNDMLLIETLIDKFIATHRINKNKIIAYGHSFGGIAAAKLLNSSIPITHLVLESTPLSLLDEVYPKGQKDLEQRFINFFKKKYLKHKMEKYFEETSLEERSITEFMNFSNKPILLLYGRNDFMYEKELVGKQVNQLRNSNPASMIKLRYYEGGHGIKRRDLSHSLFQGLLD